jgi:uncharacterized protein (DUF1697 family)
MTTRIALLRGINLAGRKRVAMPELADLASQLGLENPTTYAQSGNLVFETELDEAETVAALEEALEDHFGFDIPVICRSANEFERTAASHPFSDLGIDGRLLQVGFLDHEPVDAVEELIDIDQHAPDRLQGDGREVYLAYPNGSARSKLDHALLVRRLGVSVTLRNWRTVSKLAAMTASRDV